MALGVNWTAFVAFCAVGLRLRGLPKSVNFGRWVILAGATYYGLLISFFWVLGRKDVLWVSDSHSLHVPGVEAALEFLKGNGRLAFSSIFENQFQLTHIWAGLLGLVVGVDPITTACANLLLKVVTWMIWWRLVAKHFGDLIAAISLIFLIFIPTQVFYGLVFYKEPMVQLLVVVSLWAAVEVLSTGSLKFFLMGLGAVLLLVVERIYLAPLLGLSLVLGLAPNMKMLGLNFKTVILGSLVLGATALFSVVFFRDFSLMKIFENLAWLRHNYMNAPGVDKAWNEDIHYSLAFVKILFTPFFHPNKLGVFTDFSAFITWGAVPSQVVTALALYGVWTEFQQDRLRTLLLVVPLVLFLLLFAYLAPYSGRQRDSFYPVLSLFAAIAIVQIAGRLGLMSHKNLRLRRSRSASL